MSFTQLKAATSLQRGEREPSFDEHGFFDELLDERGRPRLRQARHYFQDLEREDLPYLIEGFQAWRNFHEYLLLKGENRINGKRLFLAVKCSKRGNDVFSRRLDQRLGFLGLLKDVRLFKPEDFTPQRLVKTNLLWITLTYNPALRSLQDAWQHIMEEWNLWITNLRNRYGKIDVLRFIEAFPGESGAAYGYPHLHVVLLFREAHFTVFPNMEEGKDGKLGLVYRIQEKAQVRDQGNWHSFIDVKALSSGKALGSYVRKYCQKTHYGDAPGALVSQSLLWLHRKQTFSMSSGFRAQLLDLITAMQGSKGVWAQKTLEGGLLDDWIWSCHGVRSYLDLGVDPEIWVQSLEEEEFHRLVGGS
jgi:hypothetical protein